jgi:hypothetical protein
MWDEPYFGYNRHCAPPQGVFSAATFGAALAALVRPQSLKDCPAMVEIQLLLCKRWSNSS